MTWHALGVPGFDVPIAAVATLSPRSAAPHCRAAVWALPLCSYGRRVLGSCVRRRCATAPIDATAGLDGDRLASRHRDQPHREDSATSSPAPQVAHNRRHAVYPPLSGGSRRRGGVNEDRPSSRLGRDTQRRRPAMIHGTGTPGENDNHIKQAKRHAASHRSTVTVRREEHG